MEKSNRLNSRLYIVKDTASDLEINLRLLPRTHRGKVTENMKKGYKKILHKSKKEFLKEKTEIGQAKFEEMLAVKTSKTKEEK